MFYLFLHLIGLDFSSFFFPCFLLCFYIMTIPHCCIMDSFSSLSLLLAMFFNIEAIPTSWPFLHHDHFYLQLLSHITTIHACSCSLPLLLLILIVAIFLHHCFPFLMLLNLFMFCIYLFLKTCVEVFCSIFILQEFFLVLFCCASVCVVSTRCSHIKMYH
jgi:hypothetical protein